MIIERRAVLVLSVALLLVLTTPGEAISAEPLADFLDQLASISSVQMESSAVIHVKMDSFSTGGGGTYWYLEQDDMFRIRCETDRNLGLLDDLEYGYDGERSLVLMIPSGSVAENTSVDREAPTALRNPFFYPVRFLFDEGTCMACRMSLTGLIQARESMTIQRLASDKFLVGNTRFPQKYTVSTETMSGISVPTRIAWVSASRGDMEMTLKDYELIDGIAWPTAIEIEGKNREGNATSRSSYFLTTLEFNEFLEPDQFSLTGDRSTPYSDPAEPPWR